ncbi:MAG: tRNA (adenosine(37)-N6)-threonylcarbamoyltransferase complex ATPase subunit type 1 TsaE [Lachnospiraceae bacterium]|nr:tRNA (adenosine(37)-N6)-threonylcarbamoyltransferase complex ATPase subunit type 1 TsaE [Lachnospiraceae bacterium]
MVYESNSAEETFEIGRRLGANAQAGQIICLDGDLGTGKTVLTKGIAAGLGITEPVVSPTFTIIQIYEGGRLPLYHFDVYRIDDPDEMEEIGYRDYFYGAGLTIIEWSKLIDELIPEDAVKVSLYKDASAGFDYRRIIIE